MWPARLMVFVMLVASSTVATSLVSPKANQALAIQLRPFANDTLVESLLVDQVGSEIRHYLLDLDFSQAMLTQSVVAANFISGTLFRLLLIKSIRYNGGKAINFMTIVDELVKMAGYSCWLVEIGSTVYFRPKLHFLGFLVKIVRTDEGYLKTSSWEKLKQYI